VPLLFGGVACYLFGNMLFQLRTLRTLTWTRVGTVLLLVVSIPVADRLPGLAALGLLTAICVGMAVVEVVAMADARSALHQVIFEERTSHEAHDAAYRARWHEPAPDEPST
jgi:hypothetical protein